MRVLSYGPPFCAAGDAPLRKCGSWAGHEIRALSLQPGADFVCGPMETARSIVERIAVDWPPDLLICWCPEIAPPPLEMEHCPVRTVAIVSDWTVYYPHLRHNLDRYDLVLMDRLGAEQPGFQAFHPMFPGPFYSHQSDVHRDLGLKRDIDIAFAGNLNAAAHPRRNQLLERVARLSERYRVEIATELPPGEYTELMNRAKIVFNHALRGEMNLRCFEAPACGALLCLERSNRECPDWLEDGIEAAYHGGDVETVLAGLLADEPRLTAMAWRGQARIDAMAGEHRWDALLAAIATAPVHPRGFCARTRRDRLLAEIFQYASSPHPEHETHVRGQLEEAWRQFPDDFEFVLAAACFDMDTLAHQSSDSRAAQTARMLEGFRRAAQLQPGSVPVWMNLAFVSRGAGNARAEERFLELALEAGSIEGAHFLLGERRDPYTMRFREDTAFQRATVHTLWAGAAARLARMLLDGGRLHDALDRAQAAIAWQADLAPAYHTAGVALHALGRAGEAAEMLATGLPYTSFDSQYRIDLAVSLRAAGRDRAARALLEESIAIFSALRGAAHVVQVLREMLTDLA